MLKIRKYIHNYKTPAMTEIIRRGAEANKPTPRGIITFIRAIFVEPPGEITNEMFDNTIWYEAYCIAQLRTMCIPKEIILDFLYNNGYKELFEDE